MKRKLLYASAIVIAVAAFVFLSSNNNEQQETEKQRIEKSVVSTSNVQSDSKIEAAKTSKALHSKVGFSKNQSKSKTIAENTIEYRLSSKELDSIEQLKKKYASFLRNHPFAKTKQLSKSERKELSLPPNAFYEQEWLYTANPYLERPEPEATLQLQKGLQTLELTGRVPGDAVDNAWVERGPNNVGGRVRTLMFAPGSTTKVFAGGVSGGLWVNNDITSAASQWQQVNGVPGNLAVSCITVDPNNTNIMYLGTGEVYTWGAVNGNGVYKSTDGGQNWVNIFGAATANVADNIVYIQDIVAWNNPGTNQTEVFIGVDAMAYTEEVTAASGGTGGFTYLGSNAIGLYRSTDGTNFARLNLAALKNASNQFYAPNKFAIGADGKLWMGTKYSYAFGAAGGMVFSTTNGGTWTNVRDLGNNGRVEIVASKQTANKLYVLLENNSGTGDLARFAVTTDGFATAPTFRTIPDDVDTGIPANDFTRGQSFYDLLIGIDPNNDNTLIIGGIDLFKTTNGGTSFAQISKWSNNNNLAALNVPLVHADHHCIAFANSSRLVLGNDGGVFYSNTGAVGATSIESRNNGLNVTQFYKAAINQTGVTQKLLAGAQDNGSQFINNAPGSPASSVAVSGGDGCWVFIDKQDDFMISSYVYNVYYRKDMNGNALNTIVNNTADGDFVNQSGYDSNSNILYTNGTNGTTYRIYRFSGATLTTQATLTNALLNDIPTYLQPSPYTANRLLVGLANGRLLRLNSANGTPTWTSIGSAAWLGAISDIRYGQSENDIFVTFHNYGVVSVWYTADGGTTWQNKEGNLPNLPVKCILQNPFALNEVIVGTELGVWATTNFNAASPNWVQSNNGMKDVKVLSFDYRSVDNTILAATYGRGMFTGEFWTCGSSTTTWNGAAWSNGTPDKRKVAVIDGNYNTATNGSFECCSLTVNAGRTANIGANNYITVSGNITVNGTLNVLNNGSLVQIDDAAVNVGNISYERTVSIRKNDYVYWSSPISTFNINGVSPATNSSFIFKWNPTVVNANGGFGNWNAANGETMVLGKGYIVKGPESFTNTAQNFTATFNNGIPNNGIITIPISRGSFTGANYNGTNGTQITKFDDNWNLIGNPYPSAIRALDFLNLNTNIEGAVRLWTHTSLPSSAISSPFYGTSPSNYTPADYITYNGLGTVSGPAGFNGYIAGGQGFFVQMNDGAAATQNVTFNNALRSAAYANNQFYRNAQGDEDPVLVASRIWLDIVDNNNNSDRTLIGYTEGATTAKDRLFDAVTAAGLTMKIYSLLEDDLLTIQGKSYPIDTNDSVALGVNIVANGNYSIAIAALDGVASDLPIYLEDKEVNIIHDLRQAPYAFSANAGQLNNRFVLRYNNETLGNNNFVLNNEVMVISNNAIQVVSNKALITNVKVYSVLGQLLFDSNVMSSNSFETSKIQKNNTALLVQVTLENGAKVTKKIVF